MLPYVLGSLPSVLESKDAFHIYNHAPGSSFLAFDMRILSFFFDFRFIFPYPRSPWETNLWSKYYSSTVHTVWRESRFSSFVYMTMGVSDPPTYLNQALHYDISIRSRWLANINITPSYPPHLFNAIPKLWKLNSALLCLCNLFQRKGWRLPQSLRRKLLFFLFLFLPFIRNILVFTSSSPRRILLWLTVQHSWQLVPPLYFHNLSPIKE